LRRQGAISERAAVSSPQRPGPRVKLNPKQKSENNWQGMESVLRMVLFHFAHDT